MAFTDTEKSEIRKWMGYADIFHDAEPRLENAMLAVEQLQDGGAAQVKIRALLVQIQQAWAAFTNVGCLENISVGNIRMDAIRARAWARIVGPTIVGQLSDALRCRPARNVFSSHDYSAVGHPYDSAHPLGGWP